MGIRQRRESWKILFVAATMTAAAQGAGVVSQVGSCPPGGCPTPNPVHETSIGPNLYWHDPCQCELANCLPSTCAASIAPNWYVLSELLPLYRDDSGGVILQRDGTTMQDVLRSSDFDSEFNAGGRFLFGVALGDWYRLEASYTGSYEWDDAITVRNDDPITDPNQAGIGNLFSPFSDFGNPSGIAGVDFNRLATISFSSKLENVEINLRRRVRLLNDYYYDRRSLFSEGKPYLFQHRAELSFLVGIRYMMLEDRLGYLTTSAVPTSFPLNASAGMGSQNQLNIRARNDLIGAQLGLLSQFLVLPRSWVDFEIKGVLFQNKVDVRTAYSLSDNAGVDNLTFRGSDERDRTSYLGEVSLVYNHQFTRTLTFRVGYTAWWLSQVALGAQNFNDNLNVVAFGPTLAQHDADIVYHGPNLGLVLAY